MSDFKNIGVIGGGAWGTALAQSACLAGCNVTLWAREEDTVNDINQNHINGAFLKDVPLDPKLRATTDLEKIAYQDAILIVTPAQFVRSVLSDLAPFLQLSSVPLIICAKGIEQSSSKLMTDVVSETVPNATPVILSGPSFASDVAKGLPTAVTLAAENKTLGKELANALSHKALRPYWSDDLIGVQIGGAIKNVLAIAAGIVMGQNLGASAHASLISRGFAELSRFGESYGAKQETMMGLSGLGDLVLTCSSPQSRNMSLGIELGKGKTLDEILASRNSVSEGVYTASAVVEISRKRNFEMPISEAVEAIVTNKQTVNEAIATLLSRPLKAEI